MCGNDCFYIFFFFRSAKTNSYMLTYRLIILQCIWKIDGSRYKPIFVKIVFVKIYFGSQYYTHNTIDDDNGDIDDSR